jgi:hypothetical protein
MSKVLRYLQVTRNFEIEILYGSIKCQSYALLQITFNLKFKSSTFPL